jgi:hypothetical protein
LCDEVRTDFSRSIVSELQCEFEQVQGVSASTADGGSIIERLFSVSHRASICYLMKLGFSELRCESQEVQGVSAGTTDGRFAYNFYAIIFSPTIGLHMAPWAMI